MAKKQIGRFKTISKQKRTSGKKGGCEEIPFDEKSRAEFLTGFHKRKLAKKRAAQEKALKYLKEEKSVARKEKRDKLKLVEKDIEMIETINKDRSLASKMKVITVD